MIPRGSDEGSEYRSLMKCRERSATPTEYHQANQAMEQNRDSVLRS